MSELMINATPTSPPSGAGTANSLGQGNAVTRPGEVATTDADSGIASPFAAVLKSRMDKKAADTETANGSANTVAADTQIDAEIAINIDLSGVFQFLVTNPVAAANPQTAPAATIAASPDEKPLPALEPAAESAQIQALAALPPVAAAAPPTSTLPAPAAALPAAPAVPTASQPAAVLASSPAATQLSPRPATADSSPGKRSSEARDEAFTPAGPPKTGGTSQAPGKMAPDAAITADESHAGARQNAIEPPANDFRALLERATAMTPAGAGAGNGSSSGTSLRIDTPLGQPAWHDEMGQKLTWMVGNNRQQADLVLTPPQLGRIEVSLTMNGDQATAIFTSSNPTVREALENSLHRLREVLADAGVSLGQTQVGSESPHQSSRKNEPDFGMNQGMRYASTIPLPATQAVAKTSTGRSMIDIFA